MIDPVRRRTLGLFAAGAAGVLLPPLARAQQRVVQGWPLKARELTGIHDVAPASDHGVWFTAQRSGHLGWWDTHLRRAEMISLGVGSRPHGVIQGPDKAAWITDGGQNTIVRVSWPARSVMKYPLPEGTPNANLNTCAFDGDGNLWFTGQAGFVGKLEVATGKVTVKPSPRGPGPYGICATPKGDIWWCSLAGSFIARIDRRTGESTIVEPPTPEQGARRVWSDSRGRIFVSEWLSGNLSMHDPEAGTWKTWKVPGEGPKAYAVWVDERDHAWVSEWSGNAIYRFDPKAETFERFALPRPYANVRQILGRPGEVWLPESGTEHIAVIRT